MTVIITLIPARLAPCHKVLFEINILLIILLEVKVFLWLIIDGAMGSHPYKL